MKKNSFKYIIKVFYILIFISLLLSPISYALNLENLNDWRPTVDPSTSIVPKADRILGIIKTVGTIVSVIALAGLGIKYILGSVEQKAEYKKTLKPYLIGAVLLFAGSQFVSIIYNWAIKFNE